MKRAIRRIGGFSLIEIMIVMVIAAAAVTLGVTWLNTERARTLRGAAADDTAREVATMARALDTYIATASSLPASGAFDVAHADLVAAGLLPPDYAMRDVGGTKFLTSPLGQAYSLRAIKQGTKYRGAVLVSAGIAATAFRKIGVDPTEQGAFDFATVMMRRAREKFLITSAVVRTGQATTDLPLSGFSADLTDLLGGPAAQPVLAALVGFSELSANPDIKVSVDPASLAGVGDGGLNLEGRECRMVSDESSQCAAGDEKVWELNACEAAADIDGKLVAGDTIREVQLGSSWYKVNTKVELGVVTGLTPAAYDSGIAWNTSSWRATNPGGIIEPRGDSVALFPAPGKDAFPLYVNLGTEAEPYNTTPLTRNLMHRPHGPGTTYSVIRQLSPLGRQGETQTPVYRVESGRICFGGSNNSYSLNCNLSQVYEHPSYPYGPGTEVLSATDPALTGGPVGYAVVKVGFSPPNNASGYTYFGCGLRVLAGDTPPLHYLNSNISVQNRAEIESYFGAAVPGGNSSMLSGYIDPPYHNLTYRHKIRAFRYKYSGSYSHKYCCRAK